MNQVNRRKVKIWREYTRERLEQLISYHNIQLRVYSDIANAIKEEEHLCAEQWEKRIERIVQEHAKDDEMRIRILNEVMLHIPMFPEE